MTVNSLFQRAVAAAIRRLPQPLQTSALFHHLAGLMGATAVANAITLSTTLIVTRLYLPEEVGAVSLLLSAAFYWASLSTLRIEAGIFSISDDKEVEATCLVALLVGLFFGLAFGPIVWALAHYRLLGFDVLPTSAVAWGAGLCIAAMAFAIARARCLREASFGQINSATLGRSVARAAVQIGGGLWLGGGFAMLALAELIALATTFVLLIRNASTSLLEAFRRLTLSVIARVFRETRQFWRFDLAGAAVDGLRPMIPLVFITAYFGAETAGLYALAERLVAVPVSQISAATGDVLQMEFSRLVRDGQRSAARRVAWSFAKRLAQVSIPVFGAVALLAPLLFGKLFGPAWEAAGILCAILSPLYCVGFVVSPMSRVLIVLRRTDYRLWYNGVALVADAIALIYGTSQGYSAEGIVALLVLANVCAYGVYGSLISRAIGTPAAEFRNRRPS